MMRIRVERTGAIGRITLARPEKKNALDLVAARELQEALREFAADAEIRVVVLGADGEDFCAGADLAALYALLDADAAAQLRDAEALGDIFRVLREMPQVVIAAVRGRALAGGAGLATACDLVLADEGARFGYPEVRVGFVPAMVMALLRRQIGEKRAFELAATGRQVGAREALELGLVSRVLPTTEFDAAVEALAKELAAMPPEALRQTKRLFYALDDVGFSDSIAQAVRVNVEARSTAEFRDGVRRFAPRPEKG
ncbi:MAG TPA: enoyl-CoA hydratase/isomerase family protein [Gemmatimonadaceae bacterium]|nr:enoyl-CoA hydratase/isomerase family protein [Gemmatimonadaceae bacterium]